MEDTTLPLTTAELDLADTDFGTSSSNSMKIFRPFACFLGGIGVLGNGLVFIVMVSNSKLRRLLTSTLIANQALVDMVCGFTLMLTYGYKSVPRINYKYNEQGREVVCFLLHNELLLFSALNASTFCLLLITIERYLMIVTPIFHRNHFTKQIAIFLALFAWIAGFLWNGIPTGMTTKVRSKSGKCSLYNYNSYKEQEIFGYIYTIATFIIPMVMFALAYGQMMVVLGKRVKQVGSQQSKDNTMNRAQINLTKTMVIVTVGFAVCWTPNQIMYMLFNAGILTNWAGPGYIATLFLAFANCCVNPFIYAFKYEGFRKAIQGIFCKSSVAKNEGSTSTSRSGV